MKHIVYSFITGLVLLTLSCSPTDEKTEDNTLGDNLIIKSVLRNSISDSSSKQLLEFNQNGKIISSIAEELDETKTAVHSYNENGDVLQVTYDSNETQFITDFVYHEEGRLSERRTVNGNGTTTYLYTHNYDLNTITTLKYVNGEPPPSTSTTYFYEDDTFQRVELFETIDLETDSVQIRETYEYDDNNLTSILTEYKYSDELMPISRIDITYDSNKNPYQIKNSSDPFQQSKTPHFLSFPSHSFIRLSENNPIKITRTTYTNDSFVRLDFDYTYSATGYPITASTSENSIPGHDYIFEYY